MVEHNDLHCKWVNHSCCRQSLDELLKSTKILDKKVKLKEQDMYVPESCCKGSFWFYTLLSLGVNVVAKNVVGFLVLETFPRRRSNFISWDHRVQSEAQILTFNPKALLYVCLFLFLSKDYSLWGHGLGLQGPTIPFLLIFVKSVLQSLPDIVVHENVLQFPLDILVSLLQGWKLKSNFIWYINCIYIASKKETFTYFVSILLLRLLWPLQRGHKPKPTLWPTSWTGETLRDFHFEKHSEVLIVLCSF